MNDVKSRSENWRVLSLPLLLLLGILLTAGAAFAGLPEGAGTFSNVGAQGNVIGPAQGTPTATATCSPGWTIHPNPAPPGDSVLNGVTALGSNDLWAVGAYTSTGVITTTTLTVRGNGTSWSYVPSPNPPSSKAMLQAVAGVASNDVWAVGEYIGGPYNQWQTLTMHWDGAAWTIVPSPNYVYNNRLYAVTAIASNDVWAVGMTGSGGFHVWGLIEHWDGTSWSIVTSPNQIPPLYGVAGVSANDVWAVGGGIPDFPAYGMSYIAHWNGSAWSTVASPANSGSSLHAVSVAAANDAWAVGYYGGYGTGQSLIEHWNGSTWTDVSSPNPGTTTNLLYGVSARASNDVWAVGDTNQASGGVKTLALHWDGNGWFQVTTPDSPTGRDLFYAVVAPGGAGGVVWAVGEMGCTSGCTRNALIARGTPACLTPVPTWAPTATNTPTPACGLDWRGVSSPNVPGGGRVNSVAPVSANDVWAVGVYYIDLDAPEVYAHALIEHWNGTQWSIVPYDPNPGGTSYLYSVAAVASNDVWAVGSGHLIMHWNGTNWSVVPSPVLGVLQSVSAVATNDVWIVGWDYPTGDETTVDTTLTMHWNGTSWSVVPSPNQGDSLLMGVTALGPNDVWAVGYSGGPQTLIEHWNGSSWSIVPSPGVGLLQGVSAVASNDVWAVGYSGSYGSYQTLTEHWNGTSWSIVPSPNPGAGNNALYGVTAVASNDVWAVGYSLSNYNYLTVIEHWNGTQWSAMPSFNGALYGAAALAANDIWAVGDNGTYGGGLIMRYNDPCGGSVTATPTTGATNTALPPSTTSVPPTFTSTRAVPSGTVVLPSRTVVASPTTQTTPTTCTITFTDVLPGSTFHEYIMCLACRGIVSGYSDSTFRPNNEVTRGQLSKIVSGAAGFTEEPGSQIFRDVPVGHTFYVWINRLARRAIMGGYECGGPGEPCINNMPYFRPSNPAIRGQTSKIVAGAAYINQQPTGQAFEDVPPSYPFYRWIEQLASRGVMGGYECGGPGEPCGPERRPYFRPGNNVTRGQSAKIVSNTFFTECATLNR